MRIFGEFISDLKMTFFGEFISDSKIAFSSAGYLLTLAARVVCVYRLFPGKNETCGLVLQLAHSALQLHPAQPPFRELAF